MAEKLFLMSLGCPKNLVDSEVMLGQLEKAGYQVVEEPEEAHLLLVNTCGFIQSAVQESIDEILALAEYKKAEATKKLVVAGCLVQRYGEGLQEELPEVDLFVGTDGFQDIVSLLHGQEPGALHLQAPVFLMDSSLSRKVSTPAHRAYIKVTEGCANHCSYCMIPSIRGGMRSRSLDDILIEARQLGKNGVKELTLVAQDLTAYGMDLRENQGPQLITLLKSLLAETSIPWLRLLYLHPIRVDKQLVEFILAEPRITPYLDIPLQHVSSTILQKMNRPYDRQNIEALLDMVRSRSEHVALRTTFMTGFPGETEEDVAETEGFLKKYHFDHVGIFAYSPEEGSKAADMPDQIPEEEKEARRDHLMKLQSDISLENNQRFVGQVEEVLVEGLSGETDLLIEGRTRFQAAEIDGCVYINAGQCSAGDFVKVRITEAHPYDLVGEVDGWDRE